ncbi:MAG: InlB B-repeat-containing protein [Lachnospiraceae bacterium]|nr:InlB B-repeat-containing protein [Lachnospiraceae bacterium]
MRGRKITERIISIILTLALVLGLVPVPTAAGETITIDKYASSLRFHITEPDGLMALSNDLTLEEGAGKASDTAQIVDWRWYNSDDRPLLPNITAEIGNVYKLRIVVQGKNDHKISQSQMKVIRINGGANLCDPDELSQTGATVTYDSENDQVTITYPYTAKCNIDLYMPSPRANAKVSDMTVPVIEKNKNWWEVDNRYKQTWEWYSIQSNGGSNVYTKLNDDDVFEEGRMYVSKNRIKFVNGRQMNLDDFGTILVNGTEMPLDSPSMKIDDEGWLEISLTHNCQQYVESVYLDIEAPQTGKMIPWQLRNYTFKQWGYQGETGVCTVDQFDASAGDSYPATGNFPGGTFVGISWYKGSSESFDASKPAAAGTSYRVKFTVKGIGSGEDMPLFENDRHQYTNIVLRAGDEIITFDKNPQNARTDFKVQFSGDQNLVTITYDFPATGEESVDPSARELIPQLFVDLQNGQASEPVDGQDATAVASGATIAATSDPQIEDKVEIISTYGGEDGHQIIDLSANNKVLTSGDKLEYGHKYKLRLHCKSKSATKYYFDDTTVVRLNGKLAEKTILPVSQGDIVYDGYHIWIEFTFIPAGYNRVTFHMQDHGNEVPEQGVVTGGYATEPEKPEAEGYTFGGWFTAGGDLFDFTATKVLANLDLYAKWTLRAHNMYYDLDGATDTAESQNRFATKTNVVYGTEFSDVYDPNQNNAYMTNLTKDGYLLEGWDAYKVEEVKEGVPVLGEKLEQVPDSMPDFDICWKANFSSQKYILSYKQTVRTEDGSASITDINWADLTWLDANGNELTQQDIEENYTKYSLEKDGFKLPTLKAQRKYTFAGWYLGSAADAPKIEKIEKGNPDLVPASGKILNVYPRFKYSQFKLEWSLDGGMVTDSSPEYTQAGNVTYGEKILFPEVFRPYYDLTGWTISYKSGATSTYTVEELETKQASEDPITMTDEDMVISAKWIEREYCVQYVLDDELARWNVWQDSPSPVPSWKPSRDSGQTEGTIGYDYFLFSTIPAIKAAAYIHMKEGANDTPSAYVFGGWYRTPQNSAYSQTYKNSSEYLSNPKKEPNMNKYENTNAGSYEYDRDLQIFQNDGWNEEDLVTSLSQQLLDSLEAPTFKLYARFKNKELSLTWNFQGGTIPDDVTYSPAIESSNTINVSSMTEIKVPAIVEKTGYQFGGWQFFLDGEATEVADPATTLEYDSVAGTLKMPSQSLTIKAKLTPIAYKISYESNSYGVWKSASTISPVWSGTAEGEDVYTVESYKSDKFRDPEKHMTVTPGYEFVGWYDLDGGHENALRNLDPDTAVDTDYAAAAIGNPVKSLRDLVDVAQTDTVRDINLIAIWKRVSYNVTWNLSGGKVEAELASDFVPAFTNYLATDVSVVKAKYGDTIKAPDITGCREGYTFRGWQFTGVDALGTYQSGTYYKTIEAEMPSTEVEFTAYWSLNEYNITYVYDPKQGSLADSTVFKYDYETSVVIPDMIPNSENPKYEFRGWYTKRPANYDENDADWDPTAKVTNIPINKTGDITLYARWYTIMVNLTWDMDGGAVITSSPYTKSGDYEFGDALRFPTASEMTKIGYDFNGWIIQAYSNNVKVDEAILGPNDEIPARFKTMKNNLVIVARWNLVQYTINYFFGVDESGNPIADYTSSQKKSVRYVYTVEDDTYSILSPTVNNRPDVKFTAWYTAKPDGFDETPGWLITTWDSKTIFDTIVKGSRTGELNLYARWEINQTYANTINTQIKDVNTAIRKLMELVYADNSFEMTPDLESRLKTAIATYDTSWYAVKYGAKRDEITDYDRMRLVEQAFEDNVSRMTQEAVDAINAIGDVTYSEAVGDRIAKARETYDKNTKIVAVKNALDKAMPKAASILAEKEALYSALAEKDQKDNAKANTVLSMAEKIPGTVELNDANKRLIYDAVDSYEALTSDQKALIPANVVKRIYRAADEYQALAAKRVADQEKANEAINAIDNIPANVKLTDEDKAKIEAARAAYDSLTSAQKALVPAGKTDTLTKREETYDNLVKKKEKADYNAAYKKWDKKNTTEKEITKKIKKTNTDTKDVKGAKFAKLRPKAKGGKNQVTLTWKKVKKANGYLVFGAQYGGKMKLLATLKGKKKTKYVHKKLASDSYYKYIVVAYKNVKKFKVKSVLAVSTTVYAAPSNSEYGNPILVKNRGALNVTQAKPGDAIQLLINVQFRGKETPIRDVRYESTNKKVASVDKSGKIVCKKAGKATIYAVGQNGMFASLKVTVVK